MSLGTLIGVWTFILLVVFLGIVWWAWSPRRKETFERLARRPLEDPEDVDKNDG